MVFDEGAYRKNVLTPFSKDTFRCDLLVKLNKRVDSIDVNTLITDLADLDLLSLLDIPEDINRDVLRNHLENIQGVLRKNQSVKAAANLLTLLDGLTKRKTGPVDLAEPDTWLRIAAEGANTLTRKIVKLAGSIAKHSLLGIVSDAELSTRMVAKGIPVGAIGELAAALHDRGIVVTQDFDLPGLTIPPGLAQAIDDAIRVGNARSLAELLTANQTGKSHFSVVECFRAAGASTDFGPRDVQAAYDAAMRAANSNYTEAIKKVTNPGNLGAVEWDAPNLHRLALQLSINLAQERRARGDDADEMVTELGMTGIIDLDARRIVNKVLTADTGVIATGITSTIDAQTLQAARAELIKVIPTETLATGTTKPETGNPTSLKPRSESGTQRSTTSPDNQANRTRPKPSIAGQFRSSNPANTPRSPASNINQATQANTKPQTDQSSSSRTVRPATPSNLGSTEPIRPRPKLVDVARYSAAFQDLVPKRDDTEDNNHNIGKRIFTKLKKEHPRETTENRLPQPESQNRTSNTQPFCTNCGKHKNPAMKFCTGCGKPTGF